MSANLFCFSRLPFRTKTKIRLWLGVGIAMVGLCVALLSFRLGEWPEPGFMTGFYVGTGGGLLGSGIVTVVRMGIYLRDAERARKAELEEMDERNRFIQMRSAQAAIWVLVGAVYLAIVVTSLSPALFLATVTLIWVLMGALILLLMNYCICRHLY